jgi:hypothetical protein
MLSMPSQSGYHCLCCFLCWLLQDDVYQAWEDLLPYHEFSVRLPKSRIAALPELLAAIPDEDYLALRAGTNPALLLLLWRL